MFIEGMIASTENSQRKKYSLQELKTLLVELTGGATRIAFDLNNEIGAPTYGQLVQANIVQLENKEYELVGQSELFASQSPIELWDGTRAYIASATPKFPFPHRKATSKSLQIYYDPSALPQEFESLIIEALKKGQSRWPVIFLKGNSSGLVCLIEVPNDSDDNLAAKDKLVIYNELLKIASRSEVSDSTSGGVKLVIHGNSIVELLVVDRKKEAKFKDNSNLMIVALEQAKGLEKQHNAQLIEFIYLGGDWKLNYFHTAEGDVISSEIGKSRAMKSIRRTLERMKDPTKTSMPYRLSDDGSPEPKAHEAKQYYQKEYNEHVFNQNQNSRMASRSKGLSRCRFCKKSPPLVSFDKIAHAAPESIGNKTLVCESECDTCNQKFGNTIENDFGQWILPLRLVSQLSGKQGLPKYEFGDFKIEVTGKGLKIIDVEGTDHVRVDMETKQLVLRIPMHEHVPIAVFKTFLKMALSVMPEKELPNFSEAIDFILDTDHSRSVKSLCPTVATAFFSGLPEPKAITAILCIRKNDNKEVPYATFAIKFGNAAFQLCIPCNLQDSECQVPIHPLLLGTGSTGISTFDLSGKLPETNFKHEYEFNSEEIIEELHQIPKDEAVTD